MSEVFEFGGDGKFCTQGSKYPYSKDGDAYSPHLKRSRVSAPLVLSGQVLEQGKTSLHVLPDECLFEVFRRLYGGQERSSCACVSKRWLMLLSTISNNDICPAVTSQSLETNKETVSTGESTKMNKSVVSESNTKIDPDLKSDGHLSRSLEGKKATDIRLAAIAVGTRTRGGLGKLAIKGNNSFRGVTNVGLKAIARGCPSLKVLSLWNVSSIDDEGISTLAGGCHMLEKVEICWCPSISDKGLLAIANNCPNLTSLTIESCSSVGNDILQSIGHLCPNLSSISIKNCPLVGDQGITSLVSSASSLTNMNLQTLNISDMSLIVIGCYGKALTHLALGGLQNLTEKGFWVMGNGQGLQKLRSITLNSCQGVTDLGVGAIGKGCPNLKQFCLCKCALLSDNGLVSFAKLSRSLENLQLDECHGITQFGLLGTILNCGDNFKALSLAHGYGIKDSNIGLAFTSSCKSMQSLSIRNCPGFGNACLAILGKICPKLQRIELTGLSKISDEGFLPFIQCCDAAITQVNLNSCEHLGDKAVIATVNVHGGTLELLNLDGCKGVTDTSLVAIAENCVLLSELDISKCRVSDNGIAALASAEQLQMRILSMSNCSLVSDKSLPYLLKLGKTLVGLNIKSCAISSGSVDVLAEKLWRCDIL